MFSGMTPAPQPVSRLTLTHLTVAERLRRVTGLADTLAATTEQLKADGDMNSLLTKVRQVPHQPRLPRGSSASTPPADGTTPGAPATSTAGPSPSGWFDPGERKKKRDSRPTATQSEPLPGPAVPSARHPPSTAATGAIKSVQAVSALPTKPSPTTTGKSDKTSLHPQKATVRTKGKSAAVQPKPASSISSKSNDQRTRAVRELATLLGEINRLPRHLQQQPRLPIRLWLRPPRKSGKSRRLGQD